MNYSSCLILHELPATWLHFVHIFWEPQVEVYGFMGHTPFTHHSPTHLPLTPRYPHLHHPRHSTYAAPKNGKGPRLIQWVVIIIFIHFPQNG